MRGDSLRDLYAKTLAVAGLALLAGAGAIVDYWPVSAPLPAVTSPRLSAPRMQTLAQRLDQEIPAPVRTRPAIVRGTIQAKNVGTARFMAPAASTAQTSPAAAGIPAVVAAAPVPQMNWVARDAQWATLLAAPSVDVAWQFAPAPAAASQPGFIGGALRKTKDSIVKTGAVTGSTIADAFRGVVGAFKKVSPF